MPEQGKSQRVVIVGSGLLPQAVAAKLNVLTGNFQTPELLPDSSLDSPDAVDAALTGADALFVELPANPADPDSLAGSRRATAALVKSARARGVGHVICCTAASPLKILGVSARRLDARAEAESVWRDSGLNVTYMVLPLFYQDLQHSLKLRRVDGQVCIAIPCANVPFDMMDVDDAADIVVSCLKLGNRCYGRCLPVSAGKVTVKQLAETLSQVLGVHVLDQKITCEQLRNRGDPISMDLANAFEFILRVDQQLKRSVAEQHLERVATFAEWCADNRDRLLEMLAES